MKGVHHLRQRWKFRMDRMPPGPERMLLRDLLKEWDENTVAALDALSDEVAEEDATLALLDQLGRALEIAEEAARCGHFAHEAEAEAVMSALTAWRAQKGGGR